MKSIKIEFQLYWPSVRFDWAPSGADCHASYVDCHVTTRDRSLFTLVATHGLRENHSSSIVTVRSAHQSVTLCEARPGNHPSSIVTVRSAHQSVTLCEARPGNHPSSIVTVRSAHQSVTLCEAQPGNHNTNLLITPGGNYQRLAQINMKESLWIKRTRMGTE